MRCEPVKIDVAFITANSASIYDHDAAVLDGGASVMNIIDNDVENVLLWGTNARELDVPHEITGLGGSTILCSPVRYHLRDCPNWPIRYQSGVTDSR
jgi:hypothetical protein